MCRRESISFSSIIRDNLMLTTWDPVYVVVFVDPFRTGL
jgi:hypothetical protein